MPVPGCPRRLPGATCCSASARPLTAPHWAGPPTAAAKPPAKLIYSAIASADGYIEDPDGSIDWGMPDEELLGFINELEQPARTYLYGRRMYEAMLYWETAHTTVQPRLFQEFTGIWQAAEVPVVVGGGKRALPGGVRSDLELLDTQRFASGAVYLRYCLQSA